MKGPLVVLMLIWVSLDPAAAIAQEIWPYRTAVIAPLPVYTDPGSDSIRTPRLSYPALTSELTRTLDHEVRFDIVSGEELRAASLSDTSELGLALAHALREDGIEQFQQYEIASAITSLTEAIRQYRDAEAVRTDARALSEAYQYLARA